MSGQDNERTIPTMPARYVAFLRAINVGGHIVKMEVLRTLFESMRLGHVKTFIASGNVIFDSSAQPQNLEKKIEQKLQPALGYRVATFVRSIADLEEIVTRQPFDHSELKEGATLFIGFLKVEPPTHAVSNILALRNVVDDLQIISREIYWLRRPNLGESLLSGAAMEKHIKGEVTVRNITTVQKIADQFRQGS